MKTELKPGKYVVAVSGGVDSMVMLDLVAGMPGVQLVVAHFNHGIRPDSSKDERLVADAAAHYELPFEVGQGRLGAKASEAGARIARYDFLYSVQKKHGADAVLTAHHQDDLLETAVLNLVRGTGRKGLTAILFNPTVIRPLINVPKSEILAYVNEHDIKWREDVTNRDTRYLRNYIRQKIIPAMSIAQRRSLLRTIGNMASRNLEIDEQVKVLSAQLKKDGLIDRRLFTSLPAAVASEVVAHWLREQGYSEFDRRKVQSLSLAVKTAKPGTGIPVTKGLKMSFSRSFAQFEEPAS